MSSSLDTLRVQLPLSSVDGRAPQPSKSRASSLRPNKSVQKSFQDTDQHAALLEKRKWLSFEELPFGNPSNPPYAAWGVFGPHDELGTLNFLTSETVRAASHEIESGIVVPLNLPIESPQWPMNPMRKPCKHSIIAKGHANDDVLEMNTQSSSHFDGLRHYPYQATMQYYNGVKQESISGPTASSELGIQNIAQLGIAGRGILLDYRNYALRKGLQYSPFETHAITLEDLKMIAEEEKVTFRTGDILLIRTGWTEEYNKLSESEKYALSRRTIRASCGVDASEEMLKWHWDNQFSAIAGDTVAYEAWPSPKQLGVSAHEVFLSGWGMPIGECWDLEQLSKVCLEKRKWSFFLTSQPLNIKNGIASPSNAMAIF